MLVDGVRVPIAGRVSMDMITVDLTLAPRAAVGSDVELWGKNLPIDEVANMCGTVGYELMCALAPRVPVTEINRLKRWRRRKHNLSVPSAAARA